MAPRTPGTPGPPREPLRSLLAYLSARRVFPARSFPPEGYWETRAERVRLIIAPERLLVYRVSDGWAPLCKFFDVAVTGETFPRVNTAAEWHERIGSKRKRQRNKKEKK